MEKALANARKLWLPAETDAVTNRLVTFQADKNDSNDRLDEIRKKYMFRRYSQLPAQNSQPSPSEATEVDRDDSPINWISKLGKTPESSPNPLPLNPHNHSLTKLQKQQLKAAQNNPLKANPNSEQLEKIDQINTRIKSILQNVKDGQKEQTNNVVSPPLLKANWSGLNARTGGHQQQQSQLALKIPACNYSSTQRRDDSENRYPSNAASPKNAARRSKSKLGSTDVFRREPALETAASQLFNEKLNLANFYSGQIKDQRERRMSFGDFNSKLYLPLSTVESQEVPSKTSLTSRRPSNLGQSELMSARIEQKHQHVSIMEFDEEDKPQPKLEAKGSDQSELNQLTKALCKQIMLDRNYRNAKYSYHDLKDKHKLESAMAAFTKHGVRLTPDILAKELMVSEAEYNPFYKSERCSFEELARCYKSAIDHWQTHIKGAFDQSKLLASNLKRDLLFSDRHSFTVEDLVRLISNETDESLRNRDLILLFRRLSTTERLAFNDFLRAVCHN